MGNRGGYLLAGFIVLLLGLERRYRLRPPGPEPAQRRLGRNFALAGLTATVIRLAERPLVEPLARRVEAGRQGLLGRQPAGRRRLLGLAAMDYTLYWWHILLHRLPLLWRLHLVHHTDLELDASTAARFHFLEFLASIPWRLAQIRLLGIDPATLRLWQRLTLAEVMFHHSNLRLPVGLERVLSWVIVTPRLHGIHHSTLKAETDSNFSSGLTLWDLLHATLRRNVPQAAVEIGVPAYRNPNELTLPHLLTLPLRRQRPAWRNQSPRRRLPSSRLALAP